MRTWKACGIGSVLCLACGGTDFIPIMEGGATDGTSGDGTSSADGSSSDGSSDAPFDANDCKGKHPLVDASLRFCETGECYCAPNDTCYPKAIAQRCCTYQVTCN